MTLGAMREEHQAKICSVLCEFLSAGGERAVHVNPIGGKIEAVLITDAAHHVGSGVDTLDALSQVLQSWRLSIVEAGAMNISVVLSPHNARMRLSGITVREALERVGDALGIANVLETDLGEFMRAAGRAKERWMADGCR